MAYEKQHHGEVMLGAYDSEDWLVCKLNQEAIERGTNTVISEITWMVPAKWKFTDWVLKNASRFHFFSDSRAVLMYPWGYAMACIQRSKFTIEFNGEYDQFNLMVEALDREYPRAQCMVEWVYGAHGESVDVPLNYRPLVKHAYPWVNGDVNDYVDSYLNSSANVLILIGPPGTGKTSFIKHLIHQSGANAKISYDENIMSNDSLFASFISGSEQFMIMEDADAFLRSREDGNTMMHRFLNVSDGLVSTTGKKLIFSTNLPSVRDIDSALMRPGRCFDVLEFRALTRAEAEKVGQEQSVTIPVEGDKFTLAEIMNFQQNTKKLRKVGF